MEIDQTEALLQHLAMKVPWGSPGLEGGFWSTLFFGDVFLKKAMMKWKSIKFFPPWLFQSPGIMRKLGLTLTSGLNLCWSQSWGYCIPGEGFGMYGYLCMVMQMTRCWALLTL